MHRLKSKKSAGIDLIPNEILKCHGLITFLVTFFNNCFSESILPTLWKQAISKPIPKSREDDPRIPLSYRGISLVSCTAKLFTSVLNIRITEFLDENDVILAEQNRFRRCRSGEHIFVLQSIIQIRQKLGLDTFAIFIDFSKAFNRINREIYCINYFT